ncbi:MAG: GNAT family N-acetyltransferase, partial [Glaciihabitans sp.]
MTSAAPPFSVRPTAESDWERVRDLRLEMLQDTPTAYAESHEDALGHDEAQWRMRAARGHEPRSAMLVAIDADGTWVGTMGAYVDDTSPLLVGVYVRPTHRGRSVGVTDALLDGIIEWAGRHGTQLRLEVHEENARAIAAYERRGFQRTGSSRPYDLDPSALEIEMSITLGQ